MSLAPRCCRWCRAAKNSNRRAHRSIRGTHPLLFAELDDIAGSLNEPLPREVYLIGQVNAFVADRGGILGFGSRRIMAVGLPLLPVLKISEFRGVVAHEFGHYYSGWRYTRTEEGRAPTSQKKKAVEMEKN